MKYDDFRDLCRDYPLISWQLLNVLAPAERQLKVQVSRWRKKGKLLSLNRNFFILNEHDRKIDPSRMYIASELYKPSYVSMEYALSHHGLIPEKVTDITCISSKKTMRFTNPFGTFSYRHIKDSCFFGFNESKDENGLRYYMASPEKALVDYIYLNLSDFKDDHRSVLLGSYRLQNTDTLSKKTLSACAGAYKSEKLLRIVREAARL